MNKERQSNYELLRLFLMLMIVAQHIINNGVLAKTGTGNYSISVSAGTLGTFLEVAVNTFVLISGYFMIKFHIKKILRLILDMMLIGEAVYLVAVLIGYREFRVIDAIYFLVPIHWWFIIYYIVLSFFAPYLNQLSDSLGKKQFLRLLIIMFFALSVAPTFLGYDFGGGVSNFIFMYLIGRYVRLNVKENIPAWIYLLGYLLFSVFSAVGDWYLHAHVGVDYTWGIKFFQSNSVFIVAASVCFFMFFQGIRFNSKMVNMLAKSSLGIYILHEHPIVREFYLEKFKVLEYVDGPFDAWLCNFLITCAIMYISCLLIETVRLVLFDNVNNKVCETIANFKIVKKIFPED